jgi:hypothetical protein
MEPSADLVNQTSPSQARSRCSDRCSAVARTCIHVDSRAGRVRSGYAPACANEWVRRIREKPRIKCAECPHRRFLPVADEVIRWHLSGHDADGQPFVASVLSDHLQTHRTSTKSRPVLQVRDRRPAVHVRARCTSTKRKVRQCLAGVCRRRSSWEPPLSVSVKRAARGVMLT